MTITMKPHHYIDIIKLHGAGLQKFVPDTMYGHAFYSIGNLILANPDVELQFTLACDDICAPCKFKGDKSICLDTVKDLQGYESKDAYNKMLDQRLINYLNLNLNRTYTSREYCKLLYENKDVIFKVWTLENNSDTKNRYELFCKGCEQYLQM